MRGRQSILAALLLLYRQLPRFRRGQFVSLAVLLVIGGLAELATIGAVFPFLAIISPGGASGRVAPLVTAIAEVGEAVGLPLFATAAALLIGLAIASATIRMWLSWVSYKFVFGCAEDLGVQLYERALHQPYSYHVMRNSSVTLSGLEKIQHVLAYVLVPLILGFTSAALAVFVFGALIALDPRIALGGSLIFVLLYGSVTLITKRQLHANSDLIADAIRHRLQSVQEGLGGIRDIILDGSQGVFLGNFRRWESAFRRAQTVNYFISVAPRFVVEAGIIVLIALLALYIQGQPGGLLAAIPMLGAIAVGAQRLLPLAQQIYASLSQISASKAVVFDVAELIGEKLDSEPLASGDVSFRKAIELHALSYSYPSGDKPALRGISLTIPKGARVGLMGKSGSGKSTLADLLMGLLDPSAGELRVDGVLLDERRKIAWRRYVAHVPQAIYLADTNIAANIAFGRDPEEIDMARVRQAARDADIDEFVMGLPDGYGTDVGERGVRLSGGQRQRLGIARALYKGAEVLILDEATSALDDATEDAVMQSIGRLSSELTVILIAHRLTTLRECDQVYELSGGKILRSGPYSQLIGDSQGSRRR